MQGRLDTGDGPVRNVLREAAHRSRNLRVGGHERIQRRDTNRGQLLGNVERIGGGFDPIGQLLVEHSNRDGCGRREVFLERHIERGRLIGLQLRVPAADVEARVGWNGEPDQSVRHEVAIRVCTNLVADRHGLVRREIVETWPRDGLRRREAEEGVRQNLECQVGTRQEVIVGRAERLLTLSTALEFRGRRLLHILILETNITEHRNVAEGAFNLGHRIEGRDFFLDHPCGVECRLLERVGAVCQEAGRIICDDVEADIA